MGSSQCKFPGPLFARNGNSLWLAYKMGKWVLKLLRYCLQSVKHNPTPRRGLEMTAGVSAGTREASLPTPLSGALCHLVSAVYQPQCPHSTSQLCCSLVHLLGTPWWQSRAPTRTTFQFLTSWLIATGFISQFAISKSLWDYLPDFAVSQWPEPYQNDQLKL